MEAGELVNIILNSLRDALMSITTKDLLMLLLNALILVMALYILRRKNRKDFENSVKVIGKIILEYSDSIRLLTKALLGEHITRSPTEIAGGSLGPLAVIESTNLEQIAEVYGLKSITIASDEGLLVESTLKDKTASEEEAARTTEAVRALSELCGGTRTMELRIDGEEVILLGSLEKPKLHYLVRAGKEILRYEGGIETVRKAVESYLVRKYG